MLQTPDFEKEDSFVNRILKKGLDHAVNKLMQSDMTLTRLKAEKIFNNITQYPKEIKPGLVSSVNMQDAVSKEWRAFPLLDEYRTPYGYADSIEQLESTLQYLSESTRIFCVSVYRDTVNAEKPWKDGYHINGGCEEYAGKNLIHYEILEYIDVTR